MWHDGASTRNKGGKNFDGLVVILAQLDVLSREIKKTNERVYGAGIGCELYIKRKRKDTRRSLIYSIWCAFPFTRKI